MRNWRKWAVVAWLSWGVWPSQAQVPADIGQTYRSGDTQAALRLINGELQRTSERDGNAAHLLLLKGLILAQQGKDREAQALFEGLIKTHPKLPEPYNNLAFLHAKAGRMEQAKQVLEAALKTNDSYATAYANLGAIYAQMAGQAYTQALNPTAKPARAASQLQWLDMVTLPGLAVATAQPVAQPVTQTPAQAAPAPAATVAAATVAAAAPTPSQATPAVAPSAPQAEVLQALEKWRSAWAARDMALYFKAYHPDFRGSSRLRSAWEQDRTQRITGQSSIAVQVLAPHITAISPERYQVRFVQVYQSSRLSTRAYKTLTFERFANRWVIVQEAV